MTLIDILTPVSDISRMVLTDTTTGGDREKMVDMANLAQEEMAGYVEGNRWWFLQEDYKLTLSATRRINFPTTNQDGDAAVLASVDLQSFRVASGPVSFQESIVFDRQDPVWTDDTNTGSPSRFTIIGEQIVWEKKPTAQWVTDNPALYFRGWRASNDMADANGSTPDCPATWRRVLIPLALYRAQRNQNDSDWVGTQKEAYTFLEEMFVKCRPTTGRARQLAAPPIFRLYGRRSTNVRS